MVYDIPEDAFDAFAKVSKFVSDINSLPYHANEELEQVTVRLLEANGFKDGKKVLAESCQPPFVRTKTAGKEKLTAFKKSIRSAQLNCVREDFDQFQHGLWYIDQPLGSSSYPDTLIILFGRVVMLEQKSSQNSSFRFNNTPPHPKTLYIFSDERHNQTRMVPASKFVTQDNYDKLDLIQQTASQEHFNSVQRQMEEAGMNDFFIYPSLRPQFLLRGGYVKTDFIQQSNQFNWHLECAELINYQLKKGVCHYLSHK